MQPYSVDTVAALHTQPASSNKAPLKAGPPSHLPAYPSYQYAQRPPPSHVSTSVGTSSNGSTPYHQRRHSGAYGNTSSAHNHPSPATSSTSTASSLRTPPDLLLNGTTTLGSGSTHWRSFAGSSSANSDKRAPPPKRLNMNQIHRRVALIESLIKADPLSPTIPSPPSSPRLTRPSAHSRASSSSTNAHREYSPEQSYSSKRREHPTSTSSTSEATAVHKRRRLRSASRSPPLLHHSRPDERRGEAAASTSQRPAESSARRVAAVAQLEPRDLSNEQWVQLAVQYRQRGRKVKHLGDERQREGSAATSSYASSKDESELGNASEVGAFHLTDAVFMYVYSFWCEDQSMPGGAACNPSNWTSLFGLIKYVTSDHEKRKDDILVGLCNLVEALVLRHLTAHEQRLLNRRLASASSRAAAPANDEAPFDATSTLQGLSQTMAKLSSDTERSAKLFQAARLALSGSALRRKAPRTWDTALGVGAELDPFSTATALDPCDPDPHAPRRAFAWPIEHVTPMPHVITFGRCLMAELASRRRLDWEPALLQRDA